ncbi:unnamed protein product [Adineta ricciae]|uniref:Uncharacterized protein n=1 Tax=Adineta ricciae TaxID=249248 RepID=A0A814MLU9_ADIRI|nr:unnamed protein product [Adineta ricciae]CAF1351890.1 unnamed protein product [Adineta ricciae]
MLLWEIVTASDEYFQADFQTPDPPESIVAEYQASFIQHTWDRYQTSQITTGMIYASSKLRLLRLDTTYRGIVASTLLDYDKTNVDGTVPASIYSLTPTTAAQPSCQILDIKPSYPLFSPNVLSVYGAIFIGSVRDEFFYTDHGALQAWQLIITNDENAVFYLNRNHTLIRYDYSTPIRNTYGTMRLFNIIPETPNITIFSNPCSSNTTSIRDRNKEYL